MKFLHSLLFAAVCFQQQQQLASVNAFMIPSQQQGSSATSRSLSAATKKKNQRPTSSSSSSLFMASEIHDNNDALLKSGNNNNNNQTDDTALQQLALEHDDDEKTPASIWQSWFQALRSEYDPQNRPPAQVDDFSLLLYDIVLLINLSASISVWVEHRLQFAYLPAALSEGCLLSLCWLAAGLFGTGAFLHSAVDGHYRDERGGPTAALRLAVTTFLNTINLRLVVALVVAVVQHRPVLAGTDAGESLVPLELGLGLVLMPAWRWLHSTYLPRL